MPGVLEGLTVIEFAGIGPGPFACMMLADHGAKVIRIERPGVKGRVGDGGNRDILNRNRTRLALDLKDPAAIAQIRELVRTADAVIEGFRPGVMERLGLGPAVCHALNPRLVYGRMTGWGQHGPLKDRAGHDINYIAMSGALHAIGPARGPPVPPLNLVGDYGGGALYLAMGVLAALLEARGSGKGQVVDAAMVDGAGSLMAMHFGLRQSGLWRNERGANAIDGGAPYYCSYATRAGGYMACGAIEKRFYLEMLERLALAGADLPEQNDRARWPELHDRLAAVFKTKTRDEWEAVFEGSDACVSPVLDMDECATHPLARARGHFVTQDGVAGPAPAPRFSRTPGAVRHPPVEAVAGTREALLEWGIAPGEIDALAEADAMAAG